MDTAGSCRSKTPSKADGNDPARRRSHRRSRILTLAAIALARGRINAIYMTCLFIAAAVLAAFATERRAG
jgi:hypothetical protein